MGKKKDKADKSKKKKSTENAVPDEKSGNIEQAAPESDNIEYAEQVTAGDVLELINTISHDLDQVNASNQSLHRQIQANQKESQRLHTVFMVVTLVLVVSIVTIGYSTAKTSTGQTGNSDAVSTGMSEMKGQINKVNSAIGSLSSDMIQIDNKLDTLSANVAGVNKIVNKLTEDVGKIDSKNTNQPYDPWRTRQYWR